MKASSRQPTSTDARLLAAADLLLQDYEELPVIAVLNAIVEARAALRQRREPVTTDGIEAAARSLLEADRPVLAAVAR